MPRENQEPIRILRSSLLFGNNGDLCPRGKGSEFIAIHVSYAREFVGSDTAELKHHVSFRGGSVTQDFLSVGPSVTQKLLKLLSVFKNSVAKLVVNGQA